MPPQACIDIIPTLLKEIKQFTRLGFPITEEVISRNHQKVFQFCWNILQCVEGLVNIQLQDKVYENRNQAAAKNDPSKRKKENEKVKRR